VFNLGPWKLSGMLTFTRTRGEIGFRKNGTALDIWIRVNGKETWYSVPFKELVGFLLTPGETMEVLDAESDGNAEAPPEVWAVSSWPSANRGDGGAGYVEADPDAGSSDGATGRAGGTYEPAASADS